MIAGLLFLVLIASAYLAYRIGLLQEGWALLMHWRRRVLTEIPNLEIEKIAYGPHRRQYLLKCNHPDHPVETDKPVVIYFHGGGWQFASPEFFQLNAWRLVERGYQVFLASHRKVPFHSYRDMQADLQGMRREVIAWMEKGGWGHQRLLVGGVSSGGHLALQFALDPKLRAMAGEVVGVFSMAAPIDLDKMLPVPTIWFLARRRGSERFQEANPVKHLYENLSIPIFLGHGGKDVIVPVATTLSFREKMKTISGKEATLFILPEANHLDIAGWPFVPNPVFPALERWLQGLETTLNFKGDPV